MAETLPEDLSALSAQELASARAATDARLTPLFRRWPALNRKEHRELRQLHDERLRLARYLGLLRRRDVRADSAAS
jgi:hypothetical protein